MTTLTIHLPEHFVQQAKNKGVFNETLLKELATQYMTAKLLESLVMTEPKIADTTWQDYLNQRNPSAVPDDFLMNRQQPILEHRTLFEEH
ncbi:hypothetical protein [Moraxella sp. ZY210820]|uniref:hypothetical protein n=1 Tax=unclassified Moraxella TaxID=2685852 RepID=UPI00272F0069|nr:hypothetical protein [Moraxella sp. ZY210820]WLF84987.1 hypothetical protein LU301_05850 [Moraxella sp. ZY210820]